jgi:UDP-3-O-[3-hydroxymyristoyl] glucosamine N-acyltransferase
MPARRLTAGEIAALVGGDLVGRDDVTIAGVAALDEATPGDASFLASSSYLPYFQASSAGVVLVAPEFRDAAAGPATRVVVPDPRGAIARVIEALGPPEAPAWGVDPTAKIGRACRWEGRVAIGPRARLAGGVRLGRDCRIGPGAELDAGVTLGDGCRVGAYALVAGGAALGDRVVVQPGARVGTEGFAWLEGADGRHRVPHVGPCRIGSDVEIGANATVDRGSLGATVIGDGTKIDNLVHVAHNVRIGARCVIMAQVGIAGSTTIADDVLIAGQAGLAGRLRVGHRARIAAQSGVIGDVAARATVSGYPARDHRAVLRQAAALARLAPMVHALERLAGPGTSRRETM